MSWARIAIVAGFALGSRSWALALGCRPQPIDVEVVPSAHVPAVPIVRFDAPAGREVGVAVLDGDEVVRVVPGVGVDGVASVPIVGLVAGEVHTLAPVIDGRLGTRVSFAAPDAPPVLTGLLASSEPGSELADGYVLGAVVDLEASGVGVWDGAGRLVWWVLVDPAWTAASPRPSRDGAGVAYAINDRLRDSDDQQLVTVAWDGGTRTERATPLAHHAVEELDGGEIAWLAWDVREVPWASGESHVLSDTVQVGDGAGLGRTVLSFFDDRGPPFVPCSHGLIPDERLGVDLYEWTHANSLVWVPEGDRLIVGSRLLDAVLAVDRTTGEVAWQAGGVQATLALDDPDTAWSHGHLSDAWDGGLLMFDNGSHHEPQVSRIVELAIDEDAGTVRAAWTAPDPDGRFVPFLGDARRLPGGGVLVSAGDAGTIDELDRDGAVRWRLELPDDAVVGRVRHLARFPP